MFLCEVLSSAKAAPVDAGDLESLLAGATSISGLAGLDKELDAAHLKQFEDQLTAALTVDVRTGPPPHRLAVHVSLVLFPPTVGQHNINAGTALRGTNTYPYWCPVILRVSAPTELRRGTQKSDGTFSLA